MKQGDKVKCTNPYEPYIGLEGTIINTHYNAYDIKVITIELDNGILIQAHEDDLKLTS